MQGNGCEMPVAQRIVDLVTLILLIWCRQSYLAMIDQKGESLVLQKSIISQNYVLIELKFESRIMQSGIKSVSYIL